MKYPKDLTGERFGRLTVCSTAPDRLVGIKKNKVKMFICICDCGNEKVIPRHRLVREETKSCGCFRKEATSERANKYQGERLDNLRLYSIWSNMNGRCSVLGNGSYERYGAKGITVCKEWERDFLLFKKWSIENDYTDTLTLDRIDSNGNYEPNNCRWLTTQEQNMNRKHLITIEFEGVEYKTAKQISEKFGVAEKVIYQRYRRGARGLDLVKPPNDTN